METSVMLESEGKGVITESIKFELIHSPIDLPYHRAICAVDIKTRAKIPAGYQIIACVIFVDRVQMTVVSISSPTGKYIASR